MSEQNGRIPEGYEDLLETTALIHVATLGPDGEPQSNSVWFDWDGEHIKFSQTKTRQKCKNVNRAPRIAVSMVDPENPYRYLEVRGEVTKIEEDPNLDFTSAIAKKYLGMDEYLYHQSGDERVVLYVKPEHTTQQGA